MLKSTWSVAIMLVPVLLVCISNPITVEATVERHDPVIEVTVTDNSQQPMAGAQVTISDMTNLQVGIPRLVVTDVTDANGKVVLELTGERALAKQRLYAAASDQTAYSITDYQVTAIKGPQGAVKVDVHAFSYTYADPARLAAKFPDLSEGEVYSLVETAEIMANTFEVEMTPMVQISSGPPLAAYKDRELASLARIPARTEQAFPWCYVYLLEKNQWGNGPLPFAQVNMRPDETIGVTFRFEHGGIIEIGSGYSIPGFSGSMKIKNGSGSAMQWAEELSVAYTPAVNIQFVKRQFLAACVWNGIPVPVAAWRDIVADGLYNDTTERLGTTTYTQITPSQATERASRHQLGDDIEHKYLDPGYTIAEAIGVSFEVPVGGGALQNEILLSSKVSSGEQTFSYDYRFQNPSNLPIYRFILDDQGTDKQMWWATIELRQPPLTQVDCELPYEDFPLADTVQWKDTFEFESPDKQPNLNIDYDKITRTNVWLKQNHPWCESDPNACVPECQVYPEQCMGAKVRTHAKLGFSTTKAKRDQQGSIYPDTMRLLMNLQFYGKYIGLLPRNASLTISKPPNTTVQTIYPTLDSGQWNLLWDSNLRPPQNRNSYNITSEALDLYQSDTKAQSITSLTGHRISWGGSMYAPNHNKTLSGYFAVTYSDHPDYCLQQ